MNNNSALEAARRILDQAQYFADQWTHTEVNLFKDGLAVARAYIRACEALEKIGEMDAEHGRGMRRIARAALSCSAPQVNSGGSKES